MQLFDTVIHRYLRVPYQLHVTAFRTPKHPRGTVVLLHGIGNTAQSWQELIPLLPKDIRIIGVDLLGFGQSPKPTWLKYDATQQARALGVTLLRLGLNQRVVLVGHSLGALVAVKAAKRYQPLVRQLILCSPPFYAVNKGSVLPARDDVLKELYRAARKHPQQLIALSPLAVKLGVANKSLMISDENVMAYTQALGSSIINQTALDDARSLRIPVRIIYGSLDPVVVAKHIVNLSKTSKNITARRILAGHEVVGRYVNVVANEIDQLFLVQR